MVGIMDLPQEIHREIVDHFMQSICVTELAKMHNLCEVSPYWKSLVLQSLDDASRKLCRRRCTCRSCQNIQKRKRDAESTKASPKVMLNDTNVKKAEEQANYGPRPHKKAKGERKFDG